MVGRVIPASNSEVKRNFGILSRSLFSALDLLCPELRLIVFPFNFNYSSFGFIIVGVHGVENGPEGFLK